MKSIRFLSFITSLMAVSIAWAEPAKEELDACCQAEVESAPFTQLSLYQLDTSYTSDAGKTVRLGDFRGQPVVLTMFFASCGYACPLLVSDVTKIKESLPAEIRDDVALVLVSFDVERDTPEALHQYKTERGLDDHWTLLHGNDDAVSELAALLGVKYKRENNGMYSHSNLITILNSEGEIAHQRAGLKGGLEETARAIVGVVNQE